MHDTRDSFKPSYLINQIRNVFSRLKEPKESKIMITDCMMSAFAMFHLKFPSLLEFDKARLDEPRVQNIKSMYGVSQVPCDTQMRQRLDDVSWETIPLAIKSLITILQRSQNLEFWDTEIKEHGKIVKTKAVSVDGTQFFSSLKIHCKGCLEKHHKNGDVTYHHQMIVGSIVSVFDKHVFPVLFEPIIKQDGETKNDCERNASKRWLKRYRELYPYMPTTIIEDGLASNAPHIKNLQKAHCRFILNAKQDDHKFLYDWFLKGEAPDCIDLTETIDNIKYHYKYMNNVPLNDSNFDVRVNVLMLEIEEQPHLTKRKALKKASKLQKTKWVWVTDYHLDEDNIRAVSKVGRARWRIENQTFQTLKSEKYHFEHNFGHGYKSLSNTLAGLMILAFLFDQILLAFNKDVQKALEKAGRFSYLTDKLQGLFHWFTIDNLEIFYRAIFEPPKRVKLG